MFESIVFFFPKIGAIGQLYENATSRRVHCSHESSNSKRSIDIGRMERPEHSEARPYLGLKTSLARARAFMPELSPCLFIQLLLAHAQIARPRNSAAIQSRLDHR